MLSNIVVPLDTSPISECAAWKAAAIARAASAAVHLVHVYEPPFPPFDGGRPIDAASLAQDRIQFENRLRRMGEGVRTRFGCACDVAMIGGVPAAAIGDYARIARADLIVMSTHGRTGMSRAWFGSVADTLARESPVPVLMVRHGDPESCAVPHGLEPAFRRVLIALDGSESAASILEPLLDMQLPPNTEVLLAEVVNPIPLPVLDYPEAMLVTAVARDVEATEELAQRARVYLAGIASRLRGNGFHNVDINVLISPNAAPTLVGFANSSRAELVALTSHGRGASRLVMGSVADKLLRGTECSMLLRRIPIESRTPAPSGKTPTKKQDFADTAPVPAGTLSN
ncbi:MAG TPA: universal stress protein [Gemmatimonadaceae bacterium]|nr:universal stress protein [Gemmatimonadaceae bacterium]